MIVQLGSEHHNSQGNGEETSTEFYFLKLNIKIHQDYTLGLITPEISQHD